MLDFISTSAEGVINIVQIFRVEKKEHIQPIRALFWNTCVELQELWNKTQPETPEKEHDRMNRHGLEPVEFQGSPRKILTRTFSYFDGIFLPLWQQDPK